MYGCVVGVKPAANVSGDLVDADVAEMLAGGTMGLSSGRDGRSIAGMLRTALSTPSLTNFRPEPPA